jgi:outer membrane immunogenic protein
MKKTFMLGVSFAVLAAAPALAADLAARPYTKAPVLEAPLSWTGFYIGGNVGGGWNTSFWDNLTDVSGLNTGVPLGQLNANGLLGGFQGGFNYQIGPKVVIGIEGEYDFADIRGDTAFRPREFNGHIHTRERNIASVTGRIGGLYHDDILIYLKGGWAWSQFRHDVSVIDGEGNTGVYPTVNDNRDGYTLGFGSEYKIDRNWSAKIEYDYYDFRSKTVLFPQGAAPVFFPSLAGPFRTDISAQTHVLKLGVNYTFGWLR